MLPEPGTPAPDFTAPDQHGSPFTLSSLRGQRVALYFYPKDDTPGCTAQACNLRDNESQLAAQGIKVVGVSTDDAALARPVRGEVRVDFPAHRRCRQGHRNCLRRVAGKEKLRQNLLGHRAHHVFA